MNTRLLSVSMAGEAGRLRPRISFLGGWLNDIGFVPGALVQAAPVEHGADFRLCDENIGSYRELFSKTKEMGGGLVQVHRSAAKGRPEGPSFSVSGHYICTGGLAIGDPLIAVYGQGLIRARKIDPVKLGFEYLHVACVSHIKARYTGEPVPKVRVCGPWLTDIGFGVGAIATAKASPGLISLDPKGAEKDPAALMKYVREKKMKIVQVCKDPHNRGEPRPYFGVSGSCAREAGFGAGDIFAAIYEGGLLKLQKLELAKLGF